MSVVALVQKDIRSQGGSKERVAALQKFFDTGPGGYGEGDIFISLRVPQSRALAKKYIYLDLKHVQALLKSKIHEERLIALLILVARFKEADAKEQKQIYDIYLKHTKFINNWDLVDTSAEHIVSGYLWDKNRKVLTELVKSEDLWERRIGMLATFYFIKKGETKDALRFAKMLLKDEHDLMHKASGWMLRELGKRVSEKDLRGFLDKYAHVMPRTMLRYSVEKLSAKDRAYYMGLKKVRS